MRAKRKIVPYIVLVAGWVMLLSLLIPHHHHSDGMPCCKPLTEMHESEGMYACGCEGHNLALLSFSQSQSSLTDTDAGFHLFPVSILFDFDYTTEPAFCEQFFRREKAVYIESLHGAWVVSASGLRAPPVC